MNMEDYMGIPAGGDPFAQSGAFASGTPWRYTATDFSWDPNVKSEAGVAAPCPFGEIISVTTGEQGISGGVVLCGDKNFNVGFYKVNENIDGDWLVSLKISGIKFNTDDDEEVFLVGINTATGTPEWDKKSINGSTQYPDNVNPASPSGSAILYVPLGILKVENKAITFVKTGCGNIVISQCAGSMTFSRA